MNKYPFFTLVAFFGFLVLGTPVVASAQFFYFDTELSKQQTFIASELEVDSTLSSQFLTLAGESIPSIFMATINTSARSVDSKYDIAVVSTTGDIAFCSALELEVSSPASVTTGPLATFSTVPLEQYGVSALSVSLPSGSNSIPGVICEVRLSVTTWQSNMDKTTAGYRDNSEHVFTVTAPPVVKINPTPASSAFLIADPVTPPTSELLESTQETTPPKLDLAPDQEPVVEQIEEQTQNLVELPAPEVVESQEVAAAEGADAPPTEQELPAEVESAPKPKVPPVEQPAVDAVVSKLAVKNDEAPPETEVISPTS